jgi:hypothetical protein
MPSRVKSGPGQCSKCDGFYTDLLEHISKRHQHDRFQQDEVEEYGLQACICGRVVRNVNGLAKHQSRYGCLGAGRDTRRHPVVPSAPSLAHVSDSLLSSLPTGTSSLTSLTSSLVTPSQTLRTPPSHGRHLPSSTSASTLTPIPRSTKSPSAHWITLDQCSHDSSAPPTPLGRPPSLPMADESEEEEPWENGLDGLMIESQDVTMDDSWNGSEGGHLDGTAGARQQLVSTLQCVLLIKCRSLIHRVHPINPPCPPQGKAPQYPPESCILRTTTLHLAPCRLPAVPSHPFRQIWP